MLEKSTIVLETWLQLRALAALVKNLGLIPSTDMAAHNGLQFQVQGLLHPLLTSVGSRQACGAQTCRQPKFPHT